MMERLLFRTNASVLSGDELRLLDVQFDSVVPLRFLFRKWFTAIFNQPCHPLDDDAVYRTVDRLRDCGILETEQIREETCVRLTNRGGELWSEERCPIWERYVTDRLGTTNSGKQFTTIVATSRSTCENFVRLGGSCGDMRGSRVRMFEIRRHALIYWRNFPRLFAAMVMNVEDPSYLDWRPRLLELEQQRTWWRDVFELQKFLPAK
jgi:hypothetical protein